VSAAAAPHDRVRPGVTLRLYPDTAAARIRTLARDLAVLGCLVLLAALARAAHDDIAGLQQLGTGVEQASQSVHSGLGTAAGAVAGLPLIGGQLARGLRAGESGPSSVARTARHANQEIATAADLIGWTLFLVPGGLLVAWFLPGRIAQVRRMTAAVRVLAGFSDDAQRRLLAQRAAFSLPYQALLRHTRHPLDDLQQGRYEPLIAALLEDAGLHDPRRRADT